MTKLFSDKSMEAITKFYGLFNFTPAQKRMYMMRGGMAAGLGFMGVGINKAWNHFKGKDKVDANNSPDKGSVNNTDTNTNADTNKVDTNNNTTTEDSANDGVSTDNSSEGGFFDWWN